jgi:hypothetical protein
MGCGIAGKKQIKVKGISDGSRIYSNDNSFNSNNNVMSNKSYCINESAWMNVVDFLSFNELKQVAKVNRMFNCISKQHDILIKFFKKRKQNEFTPSTQVSYSSFIANVYNEIPQKERCYLQKIPTFTLSPIEVN